MTNSMSKHARQHRPSGAAPTPVDSEWSATELGWIAAGVAMCLAVQRPFIPFFIERGAFLPETLQWLTYALAAATVVVLRRRLRQMLPAVLAVGVMYLLLAASFAWSSPNVAVAERWADLASALGLAAFALAAALIASGSDRSGRRVMHTLVAYSFVVVLLTGLVAVFPATDILYGPEWLGFGDGFAGIYTHKNINGESLFVVAVVFAGQAMVAAKRETKLFFALSAGVVLAIVSVSGARVAAAAAAAGLAVCAIAVFRRARSTCRSVAMTVVAVHLSLLFVVVPVIVFGLDRSLLNSREFLWRSIADEMSGSRLLVGYGYDAYWKANGEDRPAGFELAVDAHNGVLELMVDGGLLAVAAFLALAWCWWRALIGALLDRSNRLQPFVGILAAAPLLIITEAFLFQPGRILFAVLLFAIFFVGSITAEPSARQAGQQ